MRLIDADAVYKILESCEIRKATIGNHWEYGYTCGIERAESEIECAPTVDAIPIEWIKKYSQKIYDDDGGRYSSKASGIYRMIYDWEKKNETN